MFILFIFFYGDAAKPTPVSHLSEKMFAVCRMATMGLKTDYYRFLLASVCNIYVPSFHLVRALCIHNQLSFIAQFVLFCRS